MQQNSLQLRPNRARTITAIISARHDSQADQSCRAPNVKVTVAQVRQNLATKLEQRVLRWCVHISTSFSRLRGSNQQLGYLTSLNILVIQLGLRGSPFNLSNLSWMHDWLGHPLIQWDRRNVEASLSLSIHEHSRHSLEGKCWSKPIFVALLLVQHRTSCTASITRFIAQSVTPLHRVLASYSTSIRALSQIDWINEQQRLNS